MESLIALMTDFGLRDIYVGSLKGVILQNNPEAKIIDITHSVRPFDLVDAAFKLKCSYKYFPPGTVFLVGIDPEPEAEPIIITTEKYYVVCPNNGVASLMLEEELPERVHLVTATHYFLEGYGNFRVRNILAPIAAQLSKFQSPQYLGEQIDKSELRLFKIPSPERIDGNVFNCLVVDVDSFGNLILNIEYKGERPKRVIFGDKVISRFEESFRGLEKGELFVSVNPEGYLQVVSFKGSASKQLGVTRGAKVRVEF